MKIKLLFGEHRKSWHLPQLCFTISTVQCQ